MASFLANSPLTAPQRELLVAFFARETRFFLTGGAALAGFYLGERTTEDLDLFAVPGADLAEAEAILRGAAEACGAAVLPVRSYPDFRRLLATRGEERCVVDLVIDRAPPLGQEKERFGDVRVDGVREIAANKICTLLSRSEIRDLVDLRGLLAAGADLEQALSDAERKDGGADAGTLAWVLDEIALTPEARLPGGTSATELDAFRQTLVRRLRALAFARARKL
ncbi:MAG: nucleotidyl transferase AbiEii/AbiGii toxin family protein [Deltaproteobacteria bacterium]